jgi:hypothetical protein
MTIEELYKLLDETVSKLDDANIDDRSKTELEILTLQLQIQLEGAVFDVLKDLDTVTVADVSKLPALCKEVEQEIRNEQQRVQLVQRLTATAKMVLKAAGLPIPS